MRSVFVISRGSGTPEAPLRVRDGAAVIGDAIHVIGRCNAGITPSQERITIE